MTKRLSPFIAFMLGIVCSAFISPSPISAQTSNSPCAIEAASPENAAAADTATDSATRQSPQPETTPDPAPPLPMLRLSELLPDPEGKDEDGEFIELINDGDSDAGTQGWAIETSSGKSFAPSVTIARGGRYAFAYAETKMQLPNAGATVTLRDPSGLPTDAVTYPAAKTGKSYSRNDSGTWQWTSYATPGSANAFDAQEPAAAPPSDEAPPSPPVPVDMVTPPTPIEVPADAVVPPSVPDVRINEFLPDPAGSDDGEWIELHNPTDAEISLDGLVIDDAEGGSSPYALTGIRIAANGFGVIPKSLSKIALNNTGDDVRVIDATGAVIAAVRYDIAPEGRSYALIDGTWAWTDLHTPGTANEATTPPVMPATDAGAGAVVPSAEQAEQTNLEALDDADDGALLMISGTVTVPPGVLGKKTFAIQDGEVAVIVRAYGNAPLPTLTAGDIARIAGRVGAAHVFATNGRMVTRVGTGRVVFLQRTIDALGEGDAGLAVRVRGTVTRRSATGFTLTDDEFGAEMAVRPVTQPPKDELAVGSIVAARGIVRVRNDKTELVAAAVESVEGPVQTQADGEPVTPVVTERERLSFGAPAERSPGTPIAAGFMGTAAALAVAVAYLRRRKNGAAGDLAADG